MEYNHDQHVRAYYDEIMPGFGKFAGERRAVEAAYVKMLCGFVHDDFGNSVDGAGYYARVLFEEAPFIVCFVECQSGFVFELSNEQYELEFQGYMEAQEQDQDE
jgi:hypothetical protein